MLTRMPNPESKQAIAARLEITRFALGFKTQAAFAAKLGEGVTPQRWNNYESGRDRLTLNLALVICRTFPAVTLDWLYRADKGTLRQQFITALDDSEKMLKRLVR